MAKQDKKQKSSNSLQDLAKLTGMEKETKNVSSQETAQNFYSFLHKRNRFYEEDVKLKEKKRGIEREKREPIHNKFEIKKINVDYYEIVRKDSRNGDWKEETKYVEISKEFIWQSNDFYPNFAKRHKANAELLTGNQVNVQNFKPDWRLVVGLGSGSVFETSIFLHHVYGFPYIPASAVKGALRSYLITTLQGTEAESEALLFQKSKEMCDIFGCGKDTQYEGGKLNTFYNEEREGNIIFFDAYPTHSPQDCIKADIMNPHYPDYYGYEVGSQKFQPPADYQSPNPIIFLTVEKLTFQFMIGLRKGVENETITLGAKSGDMLSVVSGFLKDALTEKGIGAKTAVGYGYMKTEEKKTVNPKPVPPSKPTPIPLIPDMEIEVKVAEVQPNGLVKARHPNNPLQMFAIQNAPNTLKEGDFVIVKCKLNRNQKLEKLIFVRPK
jgi:CRISPR type III-B/RAMP module RAMP protein Cmr6